MALLNLNQLWDHFDVAVDAGQVTDNEEPARKFLYSAKFSQSKALGVMAELLPGIVSGKREDGRLERGELKLPLWEHRPQIEVDSCSGQSDSSGQAPRRCECRE